MMVKKVEFVFSKYYTLRACVCVCVWFLNYSGKKKVFFYSLSLVLNLKFHLIAIKKKKFIP